MIRAHAYSKQRVVHAAPMQRAERYCKQCHGEALLGGKLGEPSCYSCHGQLWLATGPDAVFAPLDTHSSNQGGYLHHAALDQVSTTCIECHGDNLQGAGETGAPSCFLCHDQLWTP